MNNKKKIVVLGISILFILSLPGVYMHFLLKKIRHENIQLNKKKTAAFERLEKKRQTQVGEITKKIESLENRVNELLQGENITENVQNDRIGSEWKPKLPAEYQINKNTSTGNRQNTDERTQYVSKININRATKHELKKISGIGNKTAERIIQYRKENGYFRNLSELRNIKGIGPSTIENIKERATTK